MFRRLVRPGPNGLRSLVLAVRAAVFLSVWPTVLVARRRSREGGEAGVRFLSSRDEKVRQHLVIARFDGENEMTFIGATDIPTRGVDDFREALRAREAELVNAKKQRDVILNDIGKASDRVDAGNQTARFELVGLNKQNVAAGRLILSIEAEVREAKKRLSMAEDQVKAMELKRAQLDAVAVMGDRLFEVATPDNRRVRHRYASADGLQKMLQPGYKIVAEVFGAGNDGNGGMVEPLGQSTMKTLLAVRGDELIAFLAERGIKSIMA
jgi:hypothetical protein